MNIAIFSIAFLSIMITSFAQVFLRKAMLSITWNVSNILLSILDLLFNLWFLLGMLCYVCSLVLWLFVLSKTDVSVAYPLSSMGFLITAIVAYFFLGENISIIKLIGLFFICLGIFFISRSS